MSSGAVLSAIYNQCASIKYITGQRKNGVVLDGTEKFLTVCPSAVFALHDIQLSQELILGLRFDTANEILGKIQIDLLSEEEKRWVRNLRLISQAYSAWDKFDHKSANKKMSKITWEPSFLQPFKPSRSAESLLSNLAGDKKNSELLLLDLSNNAIRRGKEGKYDDAVARFYRITELFAQQLLERSPYHINTSDVDLSKIPELRDLLGKFKNEVDGKIRIGLEMDYNVLNELGHPLGEKCLADKQLRGRLSERNESILAHGLKPISNSLYRKLYQSLLILFESEYPDFTVKAQRVQFPWVKNKV